MQTFLRAPWLWFFALGLLASCSGKEDSTGNRPTGNSSRQASYFSFLEPARGSVYTWGEDIPVSVDAKAGAPTVDSVEFFVDRVKVGSSPPSPTHFQLSCSLQSPPRINFSSFHHISHGIHSHGHSLPSTITQNYASNYLAQQPRTSDKLHSNTRKLTRFSFSRHHEPSMTDL